jgi:SpoVK/Ycf46/Vps4 family AAA+-type ATPase
VIASTNRPFDLDEAVLRRLPRRIMVDLPNLGSREEILRVTLANNRLAASVNLTQLAEQLDGYSGSDIKEVCRETIVRIAHERAQQLEGRTIAAIPVVKTTVTTTEGGKIKTKGENEEEEEEEEEEVIDVLSPLRPATQSDFQAAMKKLKASVNENSRELQKVNEWNEKYGEIRRTRSRQQHLNMYM